MTSPHEPDAAIGPVLTTSNGTVLYQTRVLTGGRSHHLHLARHARTGNTVVVKTGGNPAKLAHEASLLAALATIPDAPPHPHLLEASQTRHGPCLIIEYIDGHHPHSLSDYRLLGAALAALHALPLTDRLHQFQQPPAQLLRPARSIAATLGPAFVSLIDRLLADRHRNHVLIHGDLASTNALINTRGCVLIDYENTALTHPGLDLGRIIFLTHLTAVPSRRKRERIQAILAGYTHHRQTPYDLTAWIITAGLQIAAWRQTRRTLAHVPPLRPVLDELQFWAAGLERVASSDEPGGHRVARS